MIEHNWKPILLAPVPPLKIRTSASYPVDLYYMLDELGETAMKYKIRGALDTIHAHTILLNDIEYLITWNEDDFKKLDEKFHIVKVRTPRNFISEFKPYLKCRL
ncbi:MAG: hypothetical protein V1492_02155 [Candidatus Micrarchaeota archaeon]